MVCTPPAGGHHPRGMIWRVVSARSRPARWWGSCSTPCGSVRSHHAVSRPVTAATSPTAPWRCCTPTAILTGSPRSVSRRGFTVLRTWRHGTKLWRLVAAAPPAGRQMAATTSQPLVLVSAEVAGASSSVMAPTVAIRANTAAALPKPMTCFFFKVPRCNTLPGPYRFPATLLATSTFAPDQVSGRSLDRSRPGRVGRIRGRRGAWQTTGPKPGRCPRALAQWALDHDNGRSGPGRVVRGRGAVGGGDETRAGGSRSQWT